MNFLPQAQIETQFHVSLFVQNCCQASQLRAVHPRIYDDVVAYLIRLHNRQVKLSSFETLSSENSLDPSVNLYWQRLSLPNGQVCSEIVVVQKGTHVYLAFLSLLPDTFGLFAPAFLPNSVVLFNGLLRETLNRIVEWTKRTGAQEITSTLYNPNLLNEFTNAGFKQVKRGPNIVGLPLPADYLLHVTAL